ncbi:MAG: PA14 domain-containing protein [Armatimonadaceae bacterium]
MWFRKASFWATSGTALFLAAGFPGIPLDLLQQGNPSGKTGGTRAAGKSPASSGEQVFQKQCAPCHGKSGEGTPAFSRALTGDLSVNQLARYISQNMPPGPKKCPPADAEKVAAYMHEAFYSPLAQERLRPARVSLSRLTVRQMRNSVSDLLAAFRPQVSAGQERGLKGEYFKSRHFRKEDRILERVDPQIKFDFGDKGPIPEKFDPHQFSIAWNGSVVAPDTGVYEFVVRTEHATNLYVNDPDTPLIDAWVKSGNDNVYRASIFLVGGRIYPIRLEFSKSTQGVDDSDKKKGKPAPPASMTLAWKRPKMAEEPIPARCLLPQWSPETYVLASPFPPDDRSMGYERGTSVSKAWDEATTTAALETAAYISNNLGEFVKNADDIEQIKAFCRKFVERALRRPLDEATVARYVDRQFAEVSDPKTAVKRVVLLTLKSPLFLYREPDLTPYDPYAVASRLSFALWDSIPDETLLKAAAEGQLVTRAQVMAQAQRMLADPRAWNKQREFFLQWLKVDQYPDLAKDAKRFPQFGPEVAADLRTSLELTLEHLVRSERADFRDLLLSDKVYLNGKLAKIYGVSLPPNAPFQPVSLEPKERAGVLTHPYILSSFAYVKTSSPIHRGVLLARNVLGRTLHPPMDAFTPLSPDLHPKLTTRERVALQTKPAACMSCHGLINPLGFSMERFDAIGRFRTTENGKPVNATGSYETPAGQVVKFNGVREFAQFAAANKDVHRAFVEKLFHAMIQQPIRAYNPQTAQQLHQNFKENGYNIQRLVAEIATEAALPRIK